MNIQFTHSSIQEYLAAEALYEDYCQSLDKTQFLGTFDDLMRGSPLWRSLIPDFFFGLLKTGDSVEPAHFPEDGRAPIVGLNFADVSDVFKGRVDEMEQLRRLLSDPKAKLICIVGRGGIGKTALLSKLCDEIERGQLRLSETATTIGCDGIIYVSCRGTDKPTVERLFHDFGRMLGSPHNEALINCWRDSSRSLADRVRFLLSKLRDGYYLLVLDNLEDVLTSGNTIADDDLQEFVEVCLATPHGLRLIATSREQVEVSNQVLWSRRFFFLDQLDEINTAALLSDMDPDGELGLRDAPEELLKEAARRCLGVPLALHKIAGILSSKKAPTLEKLLEDTTLFNEQVVENLLVEQYRLVSDDRHRVLEALAVYNKPVPADAVRYLLEPFFPEVDVDACLYDLARSYFVVHHKERNTYELYPLDQQHAYMHIPDEDSDVAKPALHQRTVGFVMRALGKNKPIYTRPALHHRAGKFYIESAETLRAGQSIEQRSAWNQDVQRRWVEAVGQAIEHFFATEAWDDLIQAHEVVKAFYLAKTDWGYIQECDGMCQRMLYAARLAGDKSEEAEWLHDWAVLNHGRGNYTVAEQSCRQGLEITHRLEGKEMLQAHLLHRLGSVMRDQLAYEQARDLYEQSVRLKEKIGDPVEVASTQQALATLLEDTGEIEQAIKILRPALEVASQADDPHRMLRFRVHLARLLRKQGNHIEAESLSVETTTLARQLDIRYYLGSILLEAGLVALCRKQYDKALDLLGESQEVADRPTTKARGFHALAMLSHHRGDFPDARRYYEGAVAFDLPFINYRCAVKLGILYLEDGKAEEAKTYLEQGVTLCQALLEKTPNLYDVLYHLALAQLGIGATDEALATYRRALEVCSSKGVVRSALQELELLRRVVPSVVVVEEAVGLLEAASRTS